jgi:hypothetical protein
MSDRKCNGPNFVCVCVCVCVMCCLSSRPSHIFIQFRAVERGHILYRNTIEKYYYLLHRK